LYEFLGFSLDQNQHFEYIQQLTFLKGLKINRDKRYSQNKKLSKKESLFY